MSTGIDTGVDVGVDNKIIIPDTAPPLEGLLVYDDFRSGDCLNPVVNDIGFSWVSTNNHGVFNNTGLVFTNDPTPTTPVYFSPPEISGTFAYWSFSSTTHSDWVKRVSSPSDYFLQFFYNGTSGNKKSCKFEGSPALEEIWAAFWVRLPTNFYCPFQNECGSGDSNGNKFWRVYQDGRSGGGDGSDNAWGYRSGDGSGNGQHEHTYSAGCFTSTGANANPPCCGNPDTITDGRNIFITANAGKWIHLVYHVRLSSTLCAGDALAEMYYKIEGEPAGPEDGYYLGTRQANVDMKADSRGFRTMEFMGDHGYTDCDIQEFSLSEFAIATSDLRNFVYTG